MQGHLIPPVNNKIQSFLKESWQKEYPLAYELIFNCIEFIFNGENYSCKPFMTVQELRKIKKMGWRNNIQVLSICADYSMMHPLHKGDAKTRAKELEILKNLIKNCSNL